MEIERGRWRQRKSRCKTLNQAFCITIKDTCSFRRGLPLTVLSQVYYHRGLINVVNDKIVMIRLF